MKASVLSTGYPDRYQPRDSLGELNFADYIPYILLVVIGGILFQSLGVHYHVNWFTHDLFRFDLAFKIDALTATAFIFVLFIGINVYQYSKRYLLSEITQTRFKSQLILCILSVELFILSGNLLTAFIGWQLIGLNLYLLLNHYHFEPAANRSAKKKFIINRLGDMCFLTAVVMCEMIHQDTSFSVLVKGSSDLFSIYGINFDYNAAIISLIFIAVMTKSAQFPFHIWLPDTMCAPTPVSALMHAGIINAGGILLIKLSTGLVAQPIIMLMVFNVGIITLIMGALFKQFQPDVKRQLAYSTMSQTGYMIMQIGLGLFGAALFHLITHGLFKATLFLNSGTQLKVKSLDRRDLGIFEIILLSIISVSIIIFSKSMVLLCGVNNAGSVVIDVFLSISIYEFISTIITTRINIRRVFFSIYSVIVLCVLHQVFLNQFKTFVC